MSYKVYDDAKNFLAEFETEAKANQYVFNNSDIAAFINDERVVEIRHVPVDAAPVLAVSKPEPKLLDAAAALTRIKALQADTVNQIIEQVIEAQGQAEFKLQHPLVIKRLEELGFIVLTYSSSGGPVESMSVSIREALA